MHRSKVRCTHCIQKYAMERPFDIITPQRLERLAIGRKTVDESRTETRTGVDQLATKPNVIALT